eukprot:13092492-Alexandrium_andersonii.AAC.1
MPSAASMPSSSSLTIPSAEEDEGTPETGPWCKEAALEGSRSSGRVLCMMIVASDPSPCTVNRGRALPHDA